MFGGHAGECFAAAIDELTAAGNRVFSCNFTPVNNLRTVPQQTPLNDTA
jgi:hypothetical protein